MARKISEEQKNQFQTYIKDNNIDQSKINNDDALNFLDNGSFDFKGRTIENNQQNNNGFKQSEPNQNVRNNGINNIKDLDPNKVKEAIDKFGKDKVNKTLSDRGIEGAKNINNSESNQNNQFQNNNGLNQNEPGQNNQNINNDNKLNTPGINSKNIDDKKNNVKKKESKEEIEAIVSQNDPNILYGMILSGDFIDSRLKLTPAYKQAENRKNNLDRFINMSNSELAYSIEQGDFLVGSQEFNDLKAINPKLVSDAERLNSLNSLNSGKVNADNLKAKIFDAISKLMNDDDKTSLQSHLSGNNELNNLNNTLSDSATKLSEYKDQLEYSKEDIRSDLGRSVSKGYVNFLHGERNREIRRKYILELAKYNTTAGQIKTISDNIKYEYEDKKQQNKDKLTNLSTAFSLYQNLTANERALEFEKQKLLFTDGNMNSDDPFIRDRGIAKAVSQLYINYPIDGMETPTTKIQKVKDRIASGMTPEEAIKSLEDEIRKTDSYKRLVNGAVSSGDWTELSNGVLLNKDTGEIKNISSFSDSNSGSGNVSNGITNNRPDRNNNPGNLKMGDVGYGIDDQNHTIFGSANEGYEALKKDIYAKMIGNTRTGLGPNSTLAELGKVYAEDTNWANAVSSLSGYSLSTKLSNMDLNTLTTSIAKQEGFTGKINSNTNVISFDEQDVPLYKAFNTKGLTSEQQKAIRNYDEFKIKANNYKKKISADGGKHIEKLIGMIEELEGVSKINRGLASMGGIPFTETEDIKATFDAFISSNSLQNLIDLKAEGATFGSLSDNELKFIQNASTKLKLTLSTSSWKAELERIKNILSKGVTKNINSTNKGENNSSFDNYYGNNKKESVTSDNLFDNYY